MKRAIHALKPIAWTDERIAVLHTRGRAVLATDERETVLRELVVVHEQLVPTDAQAARQARHAFLLALEGAPDMLEDEVLRHFIGKHITPDDFATVQWETEEQVVAVAEVLYDFRFRHELHADELHAYVHALMRHALRQFERAGDNEKKLRLLQRAPIPPTMMDAELLRMRNRLYLYEQRRVQRHKRWLYVYLGVQAIFVLFVFPFLFMEFEDGTVTSALKQHVGVILPAEPHQQLSYGKALYWSIITAASIGYGDIIPVTNGGRVLAAILGTMGVLTIAVVAGLILNWITPRSLD